MAPILLAQLIKLFSLGRAGPDGVRSADKESTRPSSAKSKQASKTSKRKPVSVHSQDSTVVSTSPRPVSRLWRRRRTVDSFFDCETTAMDSDQIDGGGLEEALDQTMLTLDISDQTTDVSNTSTHLSTSPTTIGLARWRQNHAEWTRVSNPEYDQTQREVSQLRGIAKRDYPKLYNKLVKENRPLKKPLRLADAIQVLKAGWQADGTWPTEDELRQARQHEIEENRANRRELP